MTSFSYLFILATLAGFNLLLLFIVNSLDTLKASPRQKLMILKTGLIIFAVTPYILFLFKIFSVNTVNISVPPVSYDPSAAKSMTIPEQPEFFSWAYYLFVAYLCGAGAMLLKLFYDYISTQRWLKPSARTQLQNIPVCLSEKIQSPLSFGLFKPEIYFPKESEASWSAREIQISLIHEKTHIANRDPLWKLVSLLVRAMLFFAPWAYVLHRKIELEMEILCDEITRAETDSSLEEYGNLLLAMIVPGSLKMPLATNITDSTLKRRFLAMKSRKIHRPILTSVISIFLFLTGTAAIATSSGITEKKSIYKINATLWIDGHQVSKPRIITGAGEPATISQTSNNGKDNLKIEMIANDISMPNSPDAIRIDFAADFIFTSFSAQQKFQVLLTPKKEATIQFLDKNEHNFEMRIVAERIEDQD